MLYCSAIHPLGDDLQLVISLNIFVLFVFFVDQMIFLGSVPAITGNPAKSLFFK